MVHSFFVQKLIGSPDDSSLGFLRSDNARRYVRQLPQCRKQQFSARFPNMSSGAVDLLEKMLVFDPNKRITGTSQEIEFQALFWWFPPFLVSPYLWLFSYICFCSWWGTLSPILGISSWYQWRACLCQAFLFWFWAIIMHWRSHQRAYLEGICEIQSRSSALTESPSVIM